MSSEYPWLPPLILQSTYGDFNIFFDAAYDFYAKDFIHSMPSFDGKDVKSERLESYKGKDHSFWHCIEKKSEGEPICEENRIPDISLCERIRWPRPVIEHAGKDPNVRVWSEVYRGQGTKERVHIWLKDMDYVVVLDPRGKEEGSGNPRYYYLWTTFLTEYDRKRAAMEKRYEEAQKKKKN